MLFRHRTLLMLLLLASALAAAPDSPPITTIRPAAKIATDPMPHSGDSADDPAIWVHPTDPEKSLILGTDKQGGLHTYSLDGKQLAIVSPECLPNNVDVLYGLKINDKLVDIAVASCRAPKSRGIKIWSIDPATQQLTDITAQPALPAFDGGEPYGICAYRSPKTGKAYVFINNKSGAVEQHELIPDPASGLVKSALVRTLKLKSTVEGCVADNELAVLYVAEERRGIWKFSAEPDAPAEGKLIHKVGDHHLTADVEGLTIYYAAKEKGYLIVSSQGNNTFIVYDRTGDNPYLLTIDPADAAIDDVNDTDGIDVINLRLGKNFPKGFFIVQDGSNKSGKQNFKIYPWEDIATDKLLIDTDHSPRPK